MEASGWERTGQIGSVLLGNNVNPIQGPEMPLSNGKRPLRRTLLLVGGGIAVLALVTVIVLAVAISRYKGCDLGVTYWEIGEVDLASDKTQELSFVYTPGEKVPDASFNIELRGLPEAGSEAKIPRCRLRLGIKDGEHTLCVQSLKTEPCNWHQPNAGMVCGYTDGQYVPVESMEAGKQYRVEFTMLDTAKPPEGVKAILHGSFIWKGTPTRLAR